METRGFDGAGGVSILDRFRADEGVLLLELLHHVGGAEHGFEAEVRGEVVLADEPAHVAVGDRGG
jgi:hypothetical protein